MIVLETMYDEVPENQVINNVAFKDGIAKLPDNLKAKAESICKFYNVEMTIMTGLEPVDEPVDEDEDEDE